MNKPIKIGLWLPPREDISKPITPDKPAHIDARIYKLFKEYLDKRSNIEYFEDLDFRNAVIHNDKVYLNDFCLNDLDHFIWMGMTDRSYDSYHMEVLRCLELNVKLHNSYSFFNLATDKFSTFSLLHKYGIPVSELYLVNTSNLDYLKPKFETVTFLLKPRRSSFGKGIIKTDSFEQLRDIAEYHPQKHYYLERFYENDLNEWTGITCFNDHILYGFRKKESKISGWKVYDKYNIGGETIPVKPNSIITEITKKIGKLLNANYFGLDFIKTTEGYKVVDINCSPGIYWDFIKEMNIPVAEYFFEMLKK